MTNDTNNKLLNEFKAFVKMFNTMNDTKMTLEEAAGNRDVAEAFKAFRTVTNDLYKKLHYKGVKLKTKSTTTKKQSYDMTNIPVLDKQVLLYVTNFPHRSRDQIATDLGRKVSTICGAVSRLQKNKMVCVSGTVQDLYTGRNVETICTIEEMAGDLK